MGAVSVQHSLCGREILMCRLVEITKDHHCIDGSRALPFGRKRGAYRGDGGALDPNRRHVRAGQLCQWRGDTQARRQRRRTLRRHQHTAVDAVEVCGPTSCGFGPDTSVTAFSSTLTPSRRAPG